MSRGKSKRDPFESLGEEFRSSIEAMNVEEIRDRIASVSLAQIELLEARDKDEDFQKAKETAREAGAVYREGTQMNRLKIAFAKRVLEDRGKA
jgi:hypothetical protein